MPSQSGSLGHTTRQTYDVIHDLDGIRYIHSCNMVNAIDRFFMHECSAELTQTQLAYTYELVDFEDGVSNRADLEAIDALMAYMVTSDLECAQIQGANCG